MHDQVEQMKKLDISYRILHPSCYLTNEESGETIEIPYSSLTNQYREYLSSILIYVPLTHELQLYYRFKPKLISQEIYGTTEFWNDILIINHCFRVADFKPTTLGLYDPKYFKQYLNQIMILEGIL